MRQDKKHRKVRKCKSEPNFSGQHLLHNKQIIRQIIKAAQIKSKDTVIDLGAGKGALTLDLAKKAKRVIAIENDMDFAEILREKVKDYPNITVIENDILKYRFPRSPFYVVSNIPYAITTPIMEKLLDKPVNALQGAVITMEKGAAKRFTKVPVTDPRILVWRIWFQMEIVRVVSKNNFSPPPKVDSAVLKIRRRVNPLIQPEQYLQFRGLAQYGLKYPELPIYKALAGVFTPAQIKQLVKELGVDREMPVYLLDQYQWGTVFQTMVQYVEVFRWPKPEKR